MFHVFDASLDVFVNDCWFQARKQEQPWFVVSYHHRMHMISIMKL
jgi:hypothetical protein